MGWNAFGHAAQFGFGKASTAALGQAFEASNAAEWQTLSMCRKTTIAPLPGASRRRSPESLHLSDSPATVRAWLRPLFRRAVKPTVS
jgi:hypothetical protein